MFAEGAMRQRSRRGVPVGHLAALRLTVREREVLALVAAAQTNAEIGASLNISARTAQKHLEHVFLKMGVNSRMMAALRALAAAEQWRAANRRRVGGHLPA